MSMAKQIFYHNLKNGNKTEVEIFNKEIKIQQKTRYVL